MSTRITARSLLRLIRAQKSLALFLGLMLVFRSAWADWMTVPSGSMNPTILEGDRVLVDKHAFGLRLPFTRLRLTDGADPNRGDIVVFDSPADGRTLIKRVVAVPGDRIALSAERLIVNDAVATYAPLGAAAVATLLETTRAAHPCAFMESLAGRRHAILLLPGHDAVATTAPLTVPDGMYFMLGDNRDNSADSRFIGLVPRDRILGLATDVVISFDPERHSWPRSHRLLQPLD